MEKSINIGSHQKMIHFSSPTIHQSTPVYACCMDFNLNLQYMLVGILVFYLF